MIYAFLANIHILDCLIITIFSLFKQTNNPCDIFDISLGGFYEPI